MTWQTQLKADSVPWLLSQPDLGIHYLALRDLLDLPADDAQLCAARTAARSGRPDRYNPCRDERSRVLGSAGRRGLPNPWVTLRALRVLKGAG